MKKSLLLLSLGLLFLSSCGGDTREDDLQIAVPPVAVDSLSTLEGEFIFLANSAVLKGPDFIYGVEMDSVSNALAHDVEPLKSDDFDMIPVVVKAKIMPNPGRGGWDEIVRIKEVLEIKSIKKDSSNPENIDIEIQKP